MPNSRGENDQNIHVLELRNYLLKPGTRKEFSRYFKTNFVTPMDVLGGYTLGQFKIKGLSDRFVWLRGFNDMGSRIKFLNDFYINSPTWKKYGPRANDMMINSDNVYLLRPLNNENNNGINSNLIKTAKKITIIDFYICSGTLDKVIHLFNSAVTPFLKTLDIDDSTLWVSEMSENDFPRLPVFQDKNLLVAITNYKDENECQVKQKQVNGMPGDLKKSMQQLITTQSNLKLLNLNAK